MHRQIFRKLSKNPEYVENFCKDLNNPLLFSIRNWYLHNQSP